MQIEGDSSSQGFCIQIMSVRPIRALDVFPNIEIYCQLSVVVFSWSTNIAITSYQYLNKHDTFVCPLCGNGHCGGSLMPIDSALL